LSSVPCCDIKLAGSAINDFDLLLVVSVRGQSAKRRRSIPG